MSDGSTMPPDQKGYVRLDLIGTGGHGRVYRARQKGTNRLVALKLMPARNIRAFLKEAELHARLHHSNIVQIYDAGRWEKDTEDEFDDDHDEFLVYIAMQLIEGSSLSGLLAHESLRNPTEIARLMSKVARTVDFAHQNYVVHCDLKPSNILIDRLGVPYVSDFGISQFLDRRRAPGSAATLAYTAPEQCRGEPEDRWTDVYALGIVLYQLATGQTPYRDLTVDERVDAFDREEIPAPPSEVSAAEGWTIGRKLDRDFDRICEGALAIKPTARYASASALAGDLDRWALGLPICGPRGDRPQLYESIVRFTRRNLIVFGIALIALLLVMVSASLIVSARSNLEAWILATNKLLAELNARHLSRGMREFRDHVPKLAQDAVVHRALARPNRCDTSHDDVPVETPLWRELTSQGIWKDGPDQAYLSDTIGCFHQYWPAPGPRNVYTHWYGFRSYFECAARLGMAGSRDTCVSRAFRSEYDWYQNTLRMAFATPVYDEANTWIGVYVTSWRVERPLADVALGPMSDGQSEMALLVGRDLERSAAEVQLPADAPACVCGESESTSTRVGPSSFLGHLKRPRELLIVPRGVSGVEQLVSDPQAQAIAAALNSGEKTLPRFVDPRDGREKLAAFATLAPVGAPGASPRVAAEIAPLLVVLTDRAVLDRYIVWIHLAGGLLLVLILGLFLCFVSTLARSEEERLRWLGGHKPL